MIRGLGTRIRRPLGVNKNGYTIIEVLIVLAVSSILLVAAIFTLSGQQRKTEFDQAIHDIETQINDTVNDVTTGFYPNTDNFNCDGGGLAPVLTPGSNSQGANKDCIFIGRVMHFGEQGSGGENYNIYTVVGKRQTAGRDVTSFNETHPTAIAKTVSSPPSFPESIEKKSLQYGLKVIKMYYTTGITNTDIASVGFFATLATGGNMQTGTFAVDLIPIPSALDSASTQIAGAINGLDNNSVKNPDGGVTICFESGGTAQHGIIKLGSNNRQLTTDLAIRNGGCP